MKWKVKVITEPRGRGGIKRGKWDPPRAIRRQAGSRMKRSSTIKSSKKNLFRRKMAISCTPSLFQYFKGPEFQCFLTVMRVSSLLTDSQILAQLLNKCAQNTNKATRFFFMFFVFFGYIINHTRLLRWSSGWKVFHTVKAPSRKSIVVAPEKVLKNLHKHETDGCCCCHTGNQKNKTNPLVLSKTEAVLSPEGWRHTALLQPLLAAHSVAVLCFYLSSTLQQLRFHQCPSFFSSFHFTYFSKYLPEYLQNKQNKILLDGMEQRKYLGPNAEEGFCMFHLLSWGSLVLFTKWWMVFIGKGKYFVF